MVQFLILNGGDVHAVDSDGYTPLDLAKQKNMKNTVSLLKYSQGYTSQSEVRICSARVVGRSVGPMLMACAQARNWRTWFLMPWLLVPLLFFIIDTLPFLATVAVLAAIFIFIRRLISYMWLGKDTNNPFFMSVMAAAYALSTWVYFIKIFPGSVTTAAAAATTTLHVSSTFGPCRPLPSTHTP
jgi:hypothetical protein